MRVLSPNVTTRNACARNPVGGGNAQSGPQTIRFSRSPARLTTTVARLFRFTSNLVSQDRVENAVNCRQSFKLQLINVIVVVVLRELEAIISSPRRPQNGRIAEMDPLSITTSAITLIQAAGSVSHPGTISILPAMNKSLGILRPAFYSPISSLGMIADQLPDHKLIVRLYHPVPRSRDPHHQPLRRARKPYLRPRGHRPHTQRA